MKNVGTEGFTARPTDGHNEGVRIKPYQIQGQIKEAAEVCFLPVQGIKALFSRVTDGTTSTATVTAPCMANNKVPAAKTNWKFKLVGGKKKKRRKKVVVGVHAPDILKSKG